MSLNNVKYVQNYNNTGTANSTNNVNKSVNTNPIQIFSGNTQQIDDFNEKSVDTFVKTNKVNPTVQKAIDTKLDSKNLKTYSDIDKAEKTTVNLFSANATAIEKEKAYTDFSNGILKSYDANDDGVVTVEEFAQKETDDGMKAAELTVEEFGGYIPEEVKLAAERSGNVFAQNLDINRNGKIDTEEMNFFNKTADEMDGAKDGQISAPYENALFKSVTGQIVSDKELKAVTQKYFEGQQLTDEEQKIFDKGMQTINKNMQNMSGIK